MAAGDVTFAQDGGQGNYKAHPYLVALIRWCVSCLWSTATLVLHRVLAGYTIRPSITASKTPVKPRSVSSDHLHPEPKVDCQVLHDPEIHGCDVIFVHGLYGSLGNTWRQGDWRAKYKTGPNKVPLLRPSSCLCKPEANPITYKTIDQDYHSGIQNLTNEVLITDTFFDHTVLDHVEVVDNYEMQAKFVQDLFESENLIYESNKDLKTQEGKVEIALDEDCECRDARRCDVGCGCVCDTCYSSCWPRDWIKEDYPDARVITINYTSDPYLWRPLWVKESKRLRLHERAEQMMKQLVDLGVGEKPVIWVGHSKGGLFIKQIYCEAYEAHLKIKNGGKTKMTDTQKEEPSDISNRLEINGNVFNHINETVGNNERLINDIEINDNLNKYMKGVGDENCMVRMEEKRDSSVAESSKGKEDMEWFRKQAALWSKSAGFMFYSVPHRGSPLAGIKTPLTARSIELLEISKDCSLVLSLQDRWLKATERSRPQVRSLVETCKTLMSVLWLRIVSVPSADAGIGALYGVSVDHREICKPSSRQCLLYKELMDLMHASLNQCKCDI